jgi:hypothetical protein
LQPASQIAGVSDEQVARWRDGKSKPNFFGLSALVRRAGYNIEWLATGQGPMRRDVDVGAPVAAQQQSMETATPPAPPSQAAPLDGDEELDAIESRLDADDAAQLDQARTDLLAIAGNDRLSPAARARADMLLDVRFGDQAAAARRSAVEQVVSDDIRDLGRRLQASERQAAWRPPPLVRAMIKELLYSHPDIADDEITSLLRAIRAELVPDPGDPGQGA